MLENVIHPRPRRRSTSWTPLSAARPARAVLWQASRRRSSFRLAYAQNGAGTENARISSENVRKCYKLLRKC